MDCKLSGLMELEPLERPPMAFSRSPSRNSSQESLSLSATLSTRKLSALPLTLKTQASNDHVRTRCKELIMDYKELQTQLSKFTHRSSQLSKTNSLRLTLLKFLRLRTGLFMKHDRYEKEMHSFVDRTAEYGAKVFAQWWTALLHDLATSKLSNVDRSAYLECVSRIMSREEWAFVKRSSATFSEQLILTLDYVFNKLIPLKTIPLSLNAFIGKVFAYCFMEVDNFAPLLLFTLFVKNYSMMNVSKTLPSIHHTSDSTSTHTSESALPSLQKLQGYEGDFAHLLSKDDFPPKLLAATCMYPPKVTTFDQLEINLKDNAWVKKWAGFDSDIFCSFVKHYAQLCFDIYDVNTSDDLFRCPGFVIVYAHISEIFDSSIGHIKKFRAQQYKDQSSATNEGIFSASYMSQNGARQDFQQFLSKLPIISIFAVIRSIIYECDEKLGRLVVKTIERVLMLKASKIHAYDTQTCEAIYDIFSELLVYLQHDSQEFSRQLDWHFWITGLVNMIQTGHMICQVKALCFLFNIWNLLPIDFVMEDGRDAVWISNKELTLIYNLSRYMISKAAWEELFGHWSPLIRHYYNRLIVFKIIGTSNDNYGSFLAFKKIIKSRLGSTYDLFKEEVGDSNLSLIKQLDIQPANPIVNKKLIITPVDATSSSSHINILDNFSMSISYHSLSGSNSATSSTSTLLLASNRKVYAYDIFDDAIYSSSFGSAAGPAIPRARSSTPVSPSVSSASLKRSASSSTLGRVPILSSALSFFRKVNGSQPNLQKQTTQSPLPTSPIPENSYEDLRFLRPSPYLNPNPSSFSSSSSRSPSFIKTSPSMLSSPTSSISEISDDDPDALLSIPKNRQSTKSPGSATSRVSSVSSTTSVVSMTSMDALPSPPELLRKVPDMKRFKYKFHLAFCNDSLQLQSRVTKNRTTMFIHELPSSSAPKRPTLPFEKSSVGLLHDESYATLDESDEDSDDYDEFLMIPRAKTQSFVDTSDVVEFKDLKNHLLLGKFLNEWKSVVEEYEKFMSFTNECVSNDENSFIDPMLVADIPPIKVK